ncbi:MAG: choice-of-anchor D domain-containing protein [Myxococcota bacterium]|nr:choice-of-anchor D domain-containing protein [Myxococcota bacterium]
MRTPVYVLLTLAMALIQSACDSSGSESANQADMQTTADSSIQTDVQIDMQVDMQPVPTPDLDVSQTSISLVGRAGMPSAPGTLTLSNVGDAPLTIDGLTLQPQREAQYFEISGLTDVPYILEPGTSLELEIVYLAPDAANHEATLTISSDDPNAMSYPVQLIGRVEQNCINARPSSVDVGSVDAGIRSGQFEFTIINCGDTVRTISTIVLDGDEDFSWSSRSGTELAGTVLERGDSLSLSIQYTNNRLIPGEVATGRLFISFREMDSESLSIPLTARGGSGQRCLIRADPGNLDFEIVRISRQRVLDIVVTNHGTGPCDLRDVAVEQTAGEEANGFTISQTIELGMMPPMTSRTLSVTYAPTIPNPVGERGVLTVAYFDEFANMNRAEEVLLRGSGARAMVGSVPEVIDFDETTSTTCASRQRRIGAENVGFVPICAYSYALSGEDCAQFELLETPDFGDCLALERGESAAFLVQFEPTTTGRQDCEINVTTDAQNTEVATLRITGTGTETDARVDEHEVGRLNQERDARWTLRLAAVAASVQVFVDDQLYNQDRPLQPCEENCVSYEADENRIVFEPEHHPPRGATLRIEYDAQCFDRVED